VLTCAHVVFGSLSHRFTTSANAVRVWTPSTVVVPSAIGLGYKVGPKRNHDALKAMGRSVLASGELGQHNGLPCTIIVSTTLQELKSAAGVAVTGGGTLVPMSDVIRLASNSHHYLVIYDKHTEEPLYLYRSKRLASAGQRIVLHAHDRGCTFPGCTVAGYGCQVHHAELDWAEGEQTNITDEALACPVPGVAARRWTPGWLARPVRARCCRSAWPKSR
jgi:hypothetical protein